ncbi:MAG: YukJ family protein [bacterium]
MSNSIYGVLIGKVTNILADHPDEKTPHYTLIVQTKENESFSAVINCQSNSNKKIQLLSYVDENFKGEIINKLLKLDFNFHEINYQKDINPNIAIDYIRSNLFDFHKMQALPYDIEGDNDLKGVIDKYMKKAVNNADITVYVFGTYFNGHSGKGVHNVHMNQGNRDRHYKENDIFRDGCLFIHLAEENRWIAYFLAFQNQSWKTNEHGNPMD